MAREGRFFQISGHSWDSEGELGQRGGYEYSTWQPFLWWKPTTRRCKIGGASRLNSRVTVVISPFFSSFSVTCSSIFYYNTSTAKLVFFELSNVLTHFRSETSIIASQTHARGLWLQTNSRRTKAFSCRKAEQENNLGAQTSWHSKMRSRIEMFVY